MLLLRLLRASLLVGVAAAAVVAAASREDCRAVLVTLLHVCVHVLMMMMMMMEEEEDVLGWSTSVNGRLDAARRGSRRMREAGARGAAAQGVGRKRCHREVKEEEEQAERRKKTRKAFLGLVGLMSPYSYSRALLVLVFAKKKESAHSSLFLEKKRIQVCTLVSAPAR